MSPRNAQGGALRVNTKNGCEADNILTSKIGVGRIFLKKFLLVCVRYSVRNLSRNVSLRILVNTLVTVIRKIKYHGGKDT